MKKILFILILVYSSFFASVIPDSFSQGVVISKAEWEARIDFCFVGQVGIIDEAYSNEPSLNYKLYYDDNAGQFTIGFGEFYLYCKMYHTLGSQYSGSYPSSPEVDFDNKKAIVYKRSPLDKCQGMDNFDGYWNLYGCDGSTGEWYVVQDAEAGSFDERTSTYNCIDWEYFNTTGNWKTYQGSSYLNLFIAKYRFEGTITDAGYIWQSYACAKDGVETNHYQGRVKVVAPGRTCVGNDCSGTDLGVGGGSSGGTGDISELTPKLEEIKTELTDIKNQNSDIKSEFLGKVQDVKNDILLQNQQIAVNQEDLLYKLEVLESKNQNLLSDLSEVIEQKNEDLINTIKESIDSSISLHTNNLKTDIENAELTLTDKINETQSDIDNLKDLINSYNVDNVDGRNDILTRLNGIESSINGLGASIENIGNGTGSENGNGDVIGALGDGLGKIDETLQDGLFDENSKPYLKSIDDILKSQSNAPDDTNDLNGLVGSELGFSFSNYSNLLNSGYCSAPSNITVSLMGDTYTLLDFSVINPYVPIVRAIFISLASLLGLLFFLRGSR